MNQTARALVVGIDHYPTSPLAGCVEDARRIGSLLERHDDGSPNFAVRYLTSDNEPVTRNTLLDALEDLLAQPADVVLLHFSGHGVLAEIGGHLVTVDADGHNIGVSSHDLMTRIARAPAKEIIVLLDCCDSGSFAAPSEAQIDTTVIRDGLTLLTASGPREAATETSRGGVFTSAVVEALEGGAADVVGRVTAAGIYSYLDEALGPWDQRPHMKASLERVAELRRCHPAVTPSTLRLLTEWFPSPTDEYRLDPSYEPTEKPQHDEHEGIFTQMQKCRAARLIEPVPPEEHMYFAAMNSGSCRLTPLGRRYHRLVRDNRL